MLASMRERKREIEILRSIGALSRFIVALLIIESMLIVTVGIILAVTGLLCAIALANNLLASELGLALSLQIFYPSSMIALGLIYLTTLILSLVPAWKAYAVARSIAPGSGLITYSQLNASTITAISKHEQRSNMKAKQFYNVRLKFAQTAVAN